MTIINTLLDRLALWLSWQDYSNSPEWVFDLGFGWALLRLTADSTESPLRSMQRAISARRGGR